MEEKKKRGRPKKKQTLELPEEIQKLVDDAKIDVNEDQLKSISYK